MLSLGGERLPPPPPPPPKKKKKKIWIITCTTIWVCHHYYAFFVHLLILECPDHHQNLISSSLYYPGPLHKISSQSVHDFLSNVVHRQTDKQTNATKNITSFAKEVNIYYFLIQVVFFTKFSTLFHVFIRVIVLLLQLHTEV